MNKVQLIGNIGNDPEIRTLQNGKKVCTLSLASSERWKDKKTGEKKERTEWHRIVVFNPALVTVAEKYIKKGSQIYVEGQLETRKWQDDQKKDRYTTEVILKPYRSAIKLLDRAPVEDDLQEEEDYDADGVLTE